LPLKDVVFVANGRTGRYSLLKVRKAQVRSGGWTFLM
jgi:hypothetical protein